MAFKPYKKLRLNQSIGGLLGTAGGVNGTGLKGPGGVPIAQGTNTNQTNVGYNGAQTTLGWQSQLLQALQGQQGLQDQVTQASAQNNLALQLGGAGGVQGQAGALQQQQALNSQLAGAGGVQNLSGALASQQALAAQQQGLVGQQQGLAGQYANIAAGQGPNPALAELHQATGQNVANQAALMAGQRGASSNVGLMARQAAQQGAATQQQSAGQMASTQAQQSLGALSGEAAQQQAMGQTQQAIGQTQQNIAGIAGQQIGQQQAGVGAQQQISAGLTAQQQAQQGMVAGQANTMAGQQIGATSTATQAQQSEQQLLQNALASQNQQNVGMQSNINSANAGLAQTTMQGQQGVIGGAANAIGAGIGAMAKGGEVKKFADGGDTDTASIAPTVPTVQAPVVPTAQTPAPTGPQSSFGKFLHGAANSSSQNTTNGQGFNLAGNNSGAQALQKGIGGLGSGLKNALSSAPMTPASTGMGAESGAASAMPVADIGALAAKGGLANGGGKVNANKPTQKAVKKGNSYDNDKIPAYLSEGEIVIPRSVTQSGDPVRSAADFVAKVMAKRGGRK